MKSRYPSRVLAVLALLAALVTGLPVGPAGAAGAVVSAPCTEDEFNAALDQVQSTGGGTITFDCGGPATIEFLDQKTITSNVRIDGGEEEITLTGDESTRLFWVNAGATLDLDSLVIVEGSAQFGGAIYNDGGTVTITNSVVADSEAEDGGAIYNDGGVVITNSVFGGNDAEDGGAIYNTENSILTITNSNFELNSAYEDGGAIDSEAARLTITGSWFHDNAAEFGDGGAVYSAAGNLTIDRTTFDNNYADGDGGGLFVEDGTVTILRSFFHGNEADSGLGGGLFILGDAEEGPVVVSIDRSTFSHNGADDAGGAIFVFEATVDISNTTIYENSADEDGAGILNESGAITLFNTIVAENDDEDCEGVITSIGYNLDSDESCNLDQPTDLPDTDPELSDHDDYGGQTETHLPLEGSPVIDAGPATCTSPDQRGQLAPLGDACDIGAVELGIASGPASSDGKLCVNRSTGQVTFPSASGICLGRRLYLIDFNEAGQTTLCIDQSTGQITLGHPGCSRRAEPHILPDDSSLLTCTNRVTGVVRGVADHGQCTRYDIPGAIIVEYEPNTFD